MLTKTLTSTVSSSSSTWWHRARRLVALWYFSRISLPLAAKVGGAILSIERTLFLSRLRISNCIKSRYSELERRWRWH